MTQTTKELPNIRLLVLDVDGTLTDGSICMGPAGEVCKLFSVKDGLGIQMLAAAGIQVAVITGRTSEIVARRMAELPVARVVQGCADKPAALRALCEELGISPADAAFFGDDLNDLAAMEACGSIFSIWVLFRERRLRLRNTRLWAILWSCAFTAMS